MTLQRDPLVIDDFRDMNFWLSNFRRKALTVDGIMYPSAEHAFHAQKTHDLALRQKIADASTPMAAKRLGRNLVLRSDWETVKREVMANVIAAKFDDVFLRLFLDQTNDALLIEGNRHCDNVWGSCVCPKHKAWAGKNWLGKTLMAERARRRGDENVFTRVAVTGHRPQFMTDDQTVWAYDELARLATKLRDNFGTTTGISGMAIGADAMWAETSIQTGLDLWAYIPFEDQPAKFSPSELQNWERHRATAVRELCLGTEYDVRLFHSRNDFMIRDADLMICVYDPSKTTGGTASTIKKIQAQGTAHILMDIVGRKTKIVHARH